MVDVGDGVTVVGDDPGTVVAGNLDVVVRDPPVVVVAVGRIRVPLGVVALGAPPGRAAVGFGPGGAATELVDGGAKPGASACSGPDSVIGEGSVRLVGGVLPWAAPAATDPVISTVAAPARPSAAAAWPTRGTLLTNGSDPAQLNGPATALSRPMDTSRKALTTFGSKWLPAQSASSRRAAWGVIARL